MTEKPRHPEAASGPGNPKDPVELLVAAMNSLQPADRDLVYAWLLRRALSAPATNPWPMEPAGASLAELTRTMLRQGGPGIAHSLRASVTSGQQMVPVRFSSEQHAQLRQWCAEHGFSMATVIRGLVARFLEGQLPDVSQPRDPGQGTPGQPGHPGLPPDPRQQP
jgi:hypothetical protein